MRSQRHYYDDSRYFFIKVAVPRLPCDVSLLIEVQVESYLFHVPFALLASSCQVFADCRDIPQPESSRDGESAESPLVLPSITADEFRAFLEFLFPSWFVILCSLLALTEFIAIPATPSVFLRSS